MTFRSRFRNFFSCRDSFLFSSFADRSLTKACFYEKFLYTAVIKKESFSIQLNQKRMFSTKSEFLTLIEEYKSLEQKRYEIINEYSYIVDTSMSYDGNTDSLGVKAICLRELLTRLYNKELIAFAQEILAKDINQYLNELYKKYKHLILLPKTWDENTSIDITFLDFIFFCQGNKDRLLTKNNNNNRYNILYNKNDENNIILELNKQTPYLLTKEEFSEINYSDKMMEEGKSKLEKFVQILELFVRFTKLIDLFENKEDGRDLIISIFELFSIIRHSDIRNAIELYNTFSTQCLLVIREYLELFQLSPDLANRYCKEFVITVTELKEEKGLLFEDFKEMDFENYQRVKDGLFLWETIITSITRNFIHKQYYLEKQNFVKSKNEFEDNTNKMLIVLLEFRYDLVCRFTKFFKFFIGIDYQNEILVEKNTLDNLKKFLKPYFQPLEFFLKEKFNLNKEEPYIYLIYLRLRPLIAEYHTFILEKKRFKPTKKNDFDKKINDELNAVINGTSKLFDSTQIKIYHELEKYLFDYIETKEDYLKNDFYKKFLQDPNNYKLYKNLNLLGKI